MKRILFLILIMVCALNASAQTYLEHLQTREAGKGTVTVHESSDIDKLVNGTCPMVVEIKKTTAPVAKKPEKKETASESRETAKKNPVTTTDEMNISDVDTSKKIMRNAYKVQGYRVQVYAGGNSRKDKQKAEQISNEIKSLFPGQPVYCHFYSPRWICRMGNYRTYEEAQQILSSVKNLGYTQASIVKGQITVTD